MPVSTHAKVVTNLRTNALLRSETRLNYTDRSKKYGLLLRMPPVEQLRDTAESHNGSGISRYDAEDGGVEIIRRYLSPLCSLVRGVVGCNIRVSFPESTVGPDLPKKCTVHGVRVEVRRCN